MLEQNKRKAEGPIAGLLQSHNEKQLDRLFQISLRKGFVFCPISKVANSSLKAFFIQAELMSMGQGHAAKHLDTKSVHDIFYGPLLLPIQLKQTHLERILTEKSFFRFVFVRNPIDRVLSCYLDRVLAPGSTPHKIVFNALNKTDEETVTFSEFLDFIALQEVKTMNPHWRPQYHECGYGVIAYDAVYRFETLAEGVSDVLKRFYPGQKDKIDLSANYSPAQTNAPDKRAQYISAEDEKKIRDIYKLDFESFEYA